MKMKCAVVFAFVSLAFASQASAVLRPLFPIKPAAPSNGELIVIGDDLVLRSAKKPLMHHRARTVASAWTAGYGLCHHSWPRTDYAKICRRRTLVSIARHQQ